MKSNKDKRIIKALLQIITEYNKDEIAKERILSVAINNDQNAVSIIKLTMKGEANKNTPFYFASLYTCIIEECYNEDELVWADMLYVNKNIKEQS